MPRLAHAPFSMAAAALAGLMAVSAPAGAQNRVFQNELDAAEKPSDAKHALRVTGTVSGPQGSAENVVVTLEIYDTASRQLMGTLETRSDSTGGYSFDVSKYDLNRYSLEFTTSSVRFVQASRLIEASKDEFPQTVDLKLSPGTVASGVVVDGEGNPVEGVLITAPGVRKQRSDENGRWSAHGLHVGGQMLTFSKSGYANQTLSVPSDEPAVIEGLEVVMTGARTFEGKVVNRGGNPVPHALVYLNVGDRYQQQSANEDGEFKFKGVPEDLTSATLTLLAKGYLPTDHALKAEEVRDGRAVAKIKNGVMVRGTAKFPSGEPAAGALILAGERRTNTTPQALAGADGSWKLGPFPPGEEVAFTALPPSSEATWGVADLMLQSSGDGKFKGVVEAWPKGFSSEFTGSIQGTNVELRRKDSGEGGFGAAVFYAAPWDGMATRLEGKVTIPSLEQEGTFTMIRQTTLGDGLGGLWELREKLGPSGLKVAPAQTSVAMPHITGTVVVDFQLERALKVSGEVLKADGHPFIDGVVRIVEWEGSELYQPEVAIGVGGRFEIERAPSGTFTLVAVSNDRSKMAGPFIARGGIGGLVLREGAGGEDPADN